MTNYNNQVKLEATQGNSCIRIQKSKKQPKAIKNFKLTEDATNELFNEYKKLNISPYYKFNEITQIMARDNLTKFLPDFSKQAKYTSINIIQNLPIDKNLVNTPLTDKTPPEKEQTSELSLLLLSAALKTPPYINEDEKGSTVIQNVIPIPGKELELSGSGSFKTFDWHTENVHEENPADYLILLALRKDANAFTSFMLLEDIITGLSDTMLTALLSTNFSMKTGPSYSKEKSIIRPILSKDENGDFKIYYNSDVNRCTPLDQNGEEVYYSFQSYIESSVPCYSVNIQQGEAVIISNKEALHKRDGFEISTTIEERRWLQRIYLKKQDSQDDEIRDYTFKYNTPDDLSGYLNTKYSYDFYDFCLDESHLISSTYFLFANLTND